MIIVPQPYIENTVDILPDITFITWDEVHIKRHFLAKYCYLVSIIQTTFAESVRSCVESSNANFFSKCTYLNICLSHSNKSIYFQQIKYCKRSKTETTHQFTMLMVMILIPILYSWQFTQTYQQIEILRDWIELITLMKI